MFKNSLLSLFFISSVIFQGCNDNDKVEKANSMIASNEFVLTTTNGKQLVVRKSKNGLVLDGAKGKVLIFDIFATWCPPCQATAPRLAALQKKYRKDLVVIGTTIEEGISNQKLTDFKREHHAKYTLVNSSENRKLITEIANELELGERFPIPVMAIYKDGTLVNHYIGAVEEEFVDSDIKNALKR